MKCFEPHGYIWNNHVWLTFRWSAVSNVEIPCSQHEPMHASCECSFWVWMVQMCGCLALTLFFPISISVFFVLAVVRGHYVMLMRAPHLEKCHWDVEFAELTLGLENSLPVKDISNWGHWMTRGICSTAGKQLSGMKDLCNSLITHFEDFWWNFG